ADPAGIAELLLLEGQAERARKLLGPSSGAIPDKYWIQAKTLAQARAASPLAAEKEAVARRLFYTAESDYRRSTSRASSAPLVASLLRDHAETEFVRRNRSLIESRKTAGTEYFFFFEDFRVGGAFQRSYQPGVEWAWISGPGASLPPSPESPVDLEFSVLPGTRYRCWVYAGGCCAETLTFSAQERDGSVPPPLPGTPAATGPGKDSSRPVAQTLIATPQTHAEHGGPRQPSRWGWIEIPLLEFAAAGPKTLRLLPRHPGFSVAYALVSSTREAPPGETELGKRLREADSSRARGALWIAAAGPLAEFQSPMTRSSLFAEGSLTGVLAYADVDNRRYAPQFQNTVVALRSGINQGGTVSYTLEIPKEAEWFLWARLYYPGGGVLFRSGEGIEDDPNSFFLSIDGAAEKILGNLSYNLERSQSYFRRWHWDGDSETGKSQKPAPLALGRLSRGKHTLLIRNREAVETPTFHLSPRLDMLCLSADPAYIPRDEDVRK
ncbi:MAG TPA: hypothetical protein VMU54_24815, partial [Planctomycetota bacterium]|nr:hypothetical protein [Planctomycetota bacterium]